MHRFTMTKHIVAEISLSMDMIHYLVNPYLTSEYSLYVTG